MGSSEREERVFNFNRLKNEEGEQKMLTIEYEQAGRNKQVTGFASFEAIEIYCELHGIKEYKLTRG